MDTVGVLVTFLDIICGSSLWRCWIMLLYIKTCLFCLPLLIWVAKTSQGVWKLSLLLHSCIVMPLEIKNKSIVLVCSSVQLLEEVLAFVFFLNVRKKSRTSSTSESWCCVLMSQLLRVVCLRTERHVKSVSGRQQEHSLWVWPVRASPAETWGLAAGWMNNAAAASAARGASADAGPHRAPVTVSAAAAAAAARGLSSLRRLQSLESAAGIVIVTDY